MHTVNTSTYSTNIVMVDTKMHPIILLHFAVDFCEWLFSIKQQKHPQQFAKIRNMLQNSLHRILKLGMYHGAICIVSLVTDVLYLLVVLTSSLKMSHSWTYD